MQKKTDCQKFIKKFRAKNGLEATDENLISTIHLMNTHGIDLDAALDQSSRSSNDHGVDAWYYDEKDRTLFIYQSKLSESKTLVKKGFNDLISARLWLEQIIIKGTVTSIPSDNHCLFNLYTHLSKIRGNLQKISFVLISSFDKIELEESLEYNNFEKNLIESDLNKFFYKNSKGKLVIDATEYNLEYSIPEKVKVYPINRIPEARVDLKSNSYLDLAYIPLINLVELYRQRGNILFDKNVRLSMMSKKEARQRLVNPMEETLDLITSKKLSPNIFPFYHIGVTISASSSTNDDENLLNLESPSIINGCQTINIANEYLKKLEKQKNEKAIDLYKKIKVIAKVVVGTNNEELKEITNSNNRQIPIENWQLFSNEPIHIEIEATLKDTGIFYERQNGKYDSLMNNANNAKYYPSTNGTFIKVVDLGQIIALSKRELQWAAKPSEIFLNKKNHDKIFDNYIPNNPRDIIFVYNLFKAIKRGLNKYLELPTYQENYYSQQIFKKPIIRANIFCLALLYYYQKDRKWSIRSSYSNSLSKIANTILVDDLQSFYQQVVRKTLNWYKKESKDLTVDVPKKRIENFINNLSIELGIDFNGSKPFSPICINWDEYDY